MAYQHDPDGPVVDKGALRARIFEVCGIIFVAGLIITICMKVFSSDSKRLEEALDLIRLDLGHSQFNYSVDNAEDALTISLWTVDATSIAMAAQNGNKKAAEDWASIKYNVERAIKDIYTDLSVESLSDIKLIVKLVNENNHDKMLLLYTNGNLTNDITTT